MARVLDAGLELWLFWDRFTQITLYNNGKRRQISSINQAGKARLFVVDKIK
jgi:hypothetical protein